MCVKAYEACRFGVSKKGTDERGTQLRQVDVVMVPSARADLPSPYLLTRCHSACILSTDSWVWYRVLSTRPPGVARCMDTRPFEMLMIL